MPKSLEEKPRENRQKIGDHPRVAAYRVEKKPPTNEEEALILNTLLLFVLLALPVKETGGIPWERDFAQALERAAAEKKPIFVAFNMDDEGANENTAFRLYKDPQLIERCRDFVCLIGSTGKHEPRTEMIDGESREVCSRFGNLTCAEHLMVEIRASEAYVGRDTVIAPQHILLTPSGSIVARKAYQASLNDLFKMMDMAAKEVRRAEGGGDTAELKRFKELKQQAFERNAEIRDAAIAELGRLSDLEARNTLFSLVKPGKMDATRIAAIDALATKGNYDALEVVIDCLKDRNNMIVTHAIVALEKIELPLAVESLMKYWKKKPKALIAKELIRAMAKCAPEDAEVKSLVYQAARSSKDTVVEMSAIVAMASLELDQQGLEILAGKLKERSGNVRGLGAWSLGALKLEDGVPILEAALATETNAGVRECIEAALRNIQIKSGPDDPGFANMLPRFISDDVAR